MSRRENAPTEAEVRLEQARTKTLKQLGRRSYWLYDLLLKTDEIPANAGKWWHSTTIPLLGSESSGYTFTLNDGVHLPARYQFKKVVTNTSVQKDHHVLRLEVTMPLKDRYANPFRLEWAKGVPSVRDPAPGPDPVTVPEGIPSAILGRVSDDLDILSGAVIEQRQAEVARLASLARSVGRPPVQEATE